MSLSLVVLVDAPHNALGEAYQTVQLGGGGEVGGDSPQLFNGLRVWRCFLQGEGGVSEG